MNSAYIERVNQLIATKRFKEAEIELAKLLAQDPTDPDMLSLLGYCSAQNGDFEKAHQFIGQAIGIQPDNAHYLYLQAHIYLQQEKLDKAQKSINNAIAYDPNEAHYFGLLAQIKLGQRSWEDALKAANEGLALDPQDLSCLNSRSTSLFKLNRKDEAYASVEKTLHQNPESEYTHANLGWSFLEQHDHKKALEHFRESLRLNPEYDYAKSGMVEALKARYWFYRIFLRYGFWLSNMRSGAQWAVLIGLYIGIRFIRGIREDNPELGVLLTPLIVLYTVFAFSTWVITPLSNLALRLNVYGRYALTEDQVQSSNFVGLSLLLGLFGGGLFLMTGQLVHLALLFFGGTMMIPLGSVTRGKGRNVLIGLAVVLGAIGFFALADIFMTDQIGPLATVYIFGIVGYQFIANAFIIK